MYKQVVLRVLTVILWTWTPMAFATPYCDVPEVETLDAVVRVGDDRVEGSGVVVARNRVITAAHVIEDMARPVVTINGEHHLARLLSVLDGKDIALLEVDTNDQPPIRLQQGHLSVNDEVWAVGFPRGGDQLISAGQYEGLENGDLHTTASVDHGQSGGGLISCVNGEHVLAGMITAFGAIDKGDHYERLDDYSISLPVIEIYWLLQANTVESFDSGV